jgi:putative transposase
VAFATIKGQETLAELAQIFEVHPDQSALEDTVARGRGWRFRLRPFERGSGAGGFEGASRQDRRSDAGEGFFWKARSARPHPERKAMIDHSHGPSISWQPRVLNISRGSVYCKPRPVSAGDLAIMRQPTESCRIAFRNWYLGRNVN